LDPEHQLGKQVSHHHAKTGLKNHFTWSHGWRVSALFARARERKQGWFKNAECQQKLLRECKKERKNFWARAQMSAFLRAQFYPVKSKENLNFYKAK